MDYLVYNLWFEYLSLETSRLWAFVLNIFGVFLAFPVDYWFLKNHICLKTTYVIIAFPAHSLNQDVTMQA